MIACGLNARAQDCKGFDSVLAIINTSVNVGEFERAFTLGDSLLKTDQQECKKWVELHILRGGAFLKTEQFEAGFSEYEKALALSKGKPELLVEINMHIGSAYRRTSSREKAKKHLRKALVISRLKNVSRFLPELYNSYGNVVATANSDSAIVYYERALTAYGDDCLSCQSTILNNIGSQFASSENTEKAISYFNKAIALDTSAKDSLRLMRTLFNIARVRIHDWRIQSCRDPPERVN